MTALIEGNAQYHHIITSASKSLIIHFAPGYGEAGACLILETGRYLALVSKLNISMTIRHELVNSQRGGIRQ